MQLGLCGIVLLFASVANALSYQAHLRKSQFASTTAFLVDFSITNFDSVPLQFVKYGTPFDENNGKLLTKSFKITQDFGSDAKFAAAMAKRRITASSIVTVLPGQTVTVSLNLLQSYRFPNQGIFHASVDTTLQIVSPQEGIGRLVSEVIDFTFTSSTPQLRASAPISFATPAPGTIILDENCTLAPYNLDLPQVQQIAQDADTMIQQAITRLNTEGCSPYFIQFFGTDCSKVPIVLAHYTNIAASLAAGLNLDCSDLDNLCGEEGETFAYVFPTDVTTEIHLCTAFPPAPTGTCQEDTKAGVIIHELSHFDAIAGTRDLAYGIDLVLELALNTSANATANADTIEYYAEFCGVTPAPIPTTSPPTTTSPPGTTTTTSAPYSTTTIRPYSTSAPYTTPRPATPAPYATTTTCAPTSAPKTADPKLTDPKKDATKKLHHHKKHHRVQKRLGRK